MPFIEQVFVANVPTVNSAVELKKKVFLLDRRTIYEAGDALCGWLPTFE
jgi:hypothetical protein